MLPRKMLALPPQRFIFSDVEFDDSRVSSGSRFCCFAGGAQHLPSHVFGDIARPALRRIKGDYPHRIVVLSGKQVIHNRWKPRLFLPYFAVHAPCFAEVIKDDVHRKIEVGHNTWCGVGDRILRYSQQDAIQRGRGLTFLTELMGRKRD